MKPAKEKKDIRNQIRELKQELSESTKHDQAYIIFRKLEATEEFKNADTVLCYWSLPDELPTQDFINKWHTSKTILLPVINGDNLILKKFSGSDKMVTDCKFGVKEPVGNIFTDTNKIDLIIVPGIAFDKENNRMGRGKGFYDRLLSESSAFKIGVGFDFQIIDSIPVEGHDVSMDMIITK